MTPRYPSCCATCEPRPPRPTIATGVAAMVACPTAPKNASLRLYRLPSASTAAASSRSVIETLHRGSGRADYLGAIDDDGVDLLGPLAGAGPRPRVDGVLGDDGRGGWCRAEPPSPSVNPVGAARAVVG